MKCIMTEYNFVKNEALIHTTVITCLDILPVYCTLNANHTITNILCSIAFRYLQPSATWQCNTWTIWPFERDPKAVSKFFFFVSKICWLFPNRTYCVLFIFLLRCKSRDSSWMKILQKRKNSCYYPKKCLKTFVVTNKNFTSNVYVAYWSKF